MEEVRAMEGRMRWIGHLVVFAMVLYLAAQYLKKSTHYGMLDLAILPFHEAGHFAFGIFGQTMGIAGGTIVQIGLPLGFALYFAFKRKDYFASMVSAFWLAQTLLNISTYMKDARIMVMPLFGGSDDVIHDWNYLFGKMHSLHRAVIIGEKVEFLGRLGIIVCLIAMMAWLVRTSPWWPAGAEQNDQEIHIIPKVG